MNRRAVAAFAAVLALHLGLFALISRWRSPPIPQQLDGVEISMVRGVGKDPFGQANMPTVEPIKPLQPPDIPRPVAAPAILPPLVLPVLNLAIEAPALPVEDIQKAVPDISANFISAAVPTGDGETSAAEAASTAANGRAKCEIFDVVKSALQLDPGVRTAVSLIPVKARSVANAILIWDGTWATPESMGGPLILNPIQKAVIDGVAQAPAACQDDLVRGPRLITVGDQHNTTVLAFGSGEWRWSSLRPTMLKP